jgi:hypothetical protein
LFAEVGIHYLQIPVEVCMYIVGMALVDRITVGLLGVELGLVLVGIPLKISNGQSAVDARRGPR